MKGFKVGEIAGVIVRTIERHSDERGWLAELFRQDDLPEEIYPVMSYLSLTLPGKRRGPHEHRKQTDYFCFLGIGSFKLFLWDRREESPTYGNKMVLTIPEGELKGVIVPPGVVHGYENIGEGPALIINFPNRLYKGKGRTEAVDERRYEEEDSPFTFD